jgi:hypothetical protein
VLNNVSNSASDVQVHVGLLPKEHGGMSAILLCTPSMCNGVNGQVCIVFSRRAKAWTSCSATRDRFDASLVTQLMVGKLSSLNKVTRFSRRLLQMPSITNHSITSPAISKSELVSLPVGLFRDMMSCFMLSGHSQQNTTGVHAEISPSTTPPAPCPDASTIPI